MKELHIGLKIWSTDSMVAGEAAQLVKDGTYDYIELFSVPDSLCKHGSAWKGLGVPFVIHAPHSMKGLNPAIKEMERENRRLAEEAFRFADSLRSEDIVFHPGTGGSVEESIRQLKGFNDDRILIENKPMKGLDGSICIGWSPKQVEEIITETGYRFCFDFGHAYCAAVSSMVEPMGFVGEFLKLEPALIHLTDGRTDSETDRHDRYGFGTLPLGKMLMMAPEGIRITNEGMRNATDSLSEAREDSFFLQAINELNATFPDILMRHLRHQDIDNIFRLSNDPEVRKASFNSGYIPYDKHILWMNERLHDKESMFLVFYVQNEFIGQIRFQNDETRKGFYEVSISIVASARGKGIAKSLMKAAMICIEGKKDLRGLIARVKEENRASMKLFEALGFSEFERQIVHDAPCVVFRLLMDAGRT